MLPAPRAQSHRPLRESPLGRKISELCCPAYAPGEETEFFDTGGIFVFAGESSAVRETITRAKSFCTSQPIAVTDLEAGAGRMIQDATKFPSLFAAAQAGPRLAEEMGRIAAEEGRATGFQWTFSPCVDPLLQIHNPTISFRGAGRTAEQVISIGRAYIRGLQANGMLATAKHFPGDGAGLFDQHLSTAENPLDMKEWRSLYGRIYSEMIDEGVAAIMPGHISLPAYDTPDPANGQCPPATLSPRLLKDLLRGELGFDGLIVSDAANMGGFCGFTNYYDACARFLAAGGNVLIFVRPDETFLDEMLKRIASGQLTEAAIDESLERFRTFRRQALSTQPLPAKSQELRSASSASIAREIAVAGTQLLRDRKGWLPFHLPHANRILHVRLAFPHTALHPVVDTFEKALGQAFGAVENRSDPGPDQLRRLAASGEFDAIIVSVLNEYGYGTNHIHLAGSVARNMMGGWMHWGLPVVFVSHGHPYLHCEYKAAMDCVIRTSGTVETSIPRLIQILTAGRTEVVTDEE